METVNSVAVVRVVFVQDWESKKRREESERKNKEKKKESVFDLFLNSFYLISFRCLCWEKCLHR